MRHSAWLREAHGSFFPLRGVLRLRLGVRRLRNLERPVGATQRVDTGAALLLSPSSERIGAAMRDASISIRRFSISSSLEPPERFWPALQI